MRTTLIATRGLTKRFANGRGIADLDFEVESGEVFGYLGPNGAGKTTTIRTLLDLIRPTGGSATIFDLDTHRDGRVIRRRTGYLPGELHLYENMTGADYLRFLGSLRGNDDASLRRSLAERFDCDLSEHIHDMSHGTRQKVGLIQTFMHGPDLLLLDEPTQGLDPLMQQEFYRLIDEVKDEGRTVFLSSHVLPEVERVCDRVAIIRDGRLVAVEHIAELKARSLRRLEVRFGEPVPRSAFEGVEGIRDVVVEDHVLRCSVSGDADAVIKAAARFHVVEVTSQEASLEEIFLAYYGERASDAS